MSGAALPEPVLSVRDLSIDIGLHRVVDGVAFDLRPGGCLGIVGESGSGKTLTALALLRLLPTPPARVASGAILLNGRDMMALTVDELPAVRGKDIAMVFQEPMTSLNPVMRIGDQIDEALLLHEPLGRAARTARVVELLGLVGIPSPASRMRAYPHEFSGGMRQRAMIAMALACNPRVLVADEPTTALDVTVQAQVLELLKGLRTRLGTAVVLVSHDLGVISDVADEVLVMYCGRVIERGPAAAVFSRPAHPYSEGLLRSILRAADDGGTLYQIPGSVPSPAERGPGCDFYPRCDRRMDVCLSAKPPLLPVGPGHDAACHAAAVEGA